MQKLFGVNLAGAEFGSTVPGVFNKDYTYPLDLAEHQYYVKKGLTLFRFPIRWERIQQTLLGDLSAPDLANVKSVLDTAQEAGAKVIIELHNYGIYQTGVTNNQPTVQPVTLTTVNNLVDIWIKLAKAFKDHPALYGYELMNEPHDLPDGASGWVKICQAVADAISTIDNKNFIIIPGYDWQSADRWQQSSNTLLITGKNILYSAHCYFDGDASGQYWWGSVDKANGTGRVQHFIDWLKANNVQGLVTEYGVPFGSGATTPLKTEWYPILEDFLTTLQNAPEIIGGTAWAGGPWWGEYNLTIEPTSNYQTDRQVMASYQKFPSTEVTAIPTTPAPTPTPPPSTTPNNPPTTNPTPTPPTTTPPSTPAPTIDIALLNQLIADAEVLLQKLKALLGIK